MQLEHEHVLPDFMVAAYHADGIYQAPLAYQRLEDYWGQHSQFVA